MSEGREPDLTLMEADIRNVATVAELTAELRKISEQLERIRGGVGETIVQLDRIPLIERLVIEIAQGLGIKP
jgi:hypothetical protein